MTNFMNPHAMRPQAIPMNMPQRQPMQQMPVYYDQYGRAMPQQPMQQQMYPNQQGMMQPMPQQQMYPNQQGMMQPMTQQPNVMVDQYGRVMPMQMQPNMINPNQQYVPNVPPQANRFGEPTTVTTRLTSSTVIQEDTGNRYQVPQPQQPVESRQMSVMQPQTDFTVKVTRSQLSPLNESVTVTTVTAPIQEEQFIIPLDGNLVETFLEATEFIIDEACSDPDKPSIKVKTAILCNNHYNCTTQAVVTELFEMDIKNFYKAFKPAYAKLKTKYDIVLFNSIDKLLTDRINDFLAITVNRELNIESFASDFNELLKHLRNTSECMEDDLCEHMDSYLLQFLKNKEVVDKNLDKPVDNCVVIAEELCLVYLDKLEAELGLNEVGNYTVKLSSSPANNFIRSLADCAFNSFERTRFNLVTVDRKVYEFISNLLNEIYITRLV